jgi:hypothetical protein
MRRKLQGVFRRTSPAALSPRSEELARRLVCAFEEGSLVGRFVDSYVARFGRRGLKADTLRYGELLATIRREALLAVVAQVTEELPGYLSRRPPVLRGVEVQAAEMFSQGLVAALGRASRWSAEEVEEFRRDAELYARLGARQPAPRRHRSGGPTEGPFVDRCALLLDPSMLEKARQAAGNFLLEIEQVTSKTLASVLRPLPKRL